MTAYDRRLLALEDEGRGSRLDRLADAVVLIQRDRRIEADPASIDDAERLLDKRPPGILLPSGLPWLAYRDALFRVLTLEEKERLLARLIEHQALAAS